MGALYGLLLGAEIMSGALLEGDYVYVGGLGILAVKGVSHPAGVVTAFPRLGPFADLSEAYCYIRDRFPEALVFDDHSGQVLPQIPLRSIERIYSAREGLRQLRPSDKLTRLALELAELFADATGLSMDYLGVSGSILLNTYRRDSDIDLVLLDPGVRDIISSLRELREKGETNPVTPRFARDLSVKRSGSALSLGAWIKHESRKTLYGVYRGVVYSAKFVPSPEIYWEPHGSARWRELGYALVRGVVRDASRAAYTPMRVEVSVEEVVEGVDAAWRIVEVASLRSRFSEQVLENEKYEACGRVELDLIGRRARLFVGNTARDYIVSTAIGTE